MSQKLHNILQRPVPLKIYQCFKRPHLDYGDIIYDHAYNLSFRQKLELIQYNSVLTLTEGPRCPAESRGAIRDSSREKLSQELHLESL